MSNDRDRPLNPLAPLPEPLVPLDPVCTALDRDPVLRALPELARGPLEDALRSLDETLVSHAIDTLKADGDTKNAVRAAAVALLKVLKGERFEPPVPPLYEMPPSVAPPTLTTPGETIIQLPVIKF